jgi:hypothetical protein
MSQLIELSHGAASAGVSSPLPARKHDPAVAGPAELNPSRALIRNEDLGIRFRKNGFAQSFQDLGILDHGEGVTIVVRRRRAVSKTDCSFMDWLP